MPTFKLPAVPIPGLREMSTDDIRHTLSDVRVPEIKLPDNIKLPDIDPRKVDLQGSVPKIDLSKIDLSKMDLSKVDLSKIAVPAAVASMAMNAAERAHLRRKRRSRRPYLVAGLAVAAIGFLVLRNLDWVRARISDVGRRLRQFQDADRVDASLEPIGNANGTYTDDLTAIPIEPAAYTSTAPSEETTFPTASEELADEIADRTPATAETQGESDYRTQA